MKKVIIFMLTLISLNSYGQDNTATADFKRVQIGVNVSTDIAYRTLQNNEGSQSMAHRIDSNNDIEIPKISYTAGANVSFNINKLLSLETGVQYSNKGYQTKMLVIPFETLVYDPNTPTIEGKMIYDYHYIDIPIKANFAIGQNKVRFFSSIGLTANILIDATQSSIIVAQNETTKYKQDTNYGYNKLNISPTISVGVDYKINNNMNLRVEPTFRYGILPIIDAPIQGYLYNGGLNVSYYVGF
jgi:opacity protein-like surface antigen